MAKPKKRHARRKPCAGSAPRPPGKAELERMLLEAARLRAKKAYARSAG